MSEPANGQSRGISELVTNVQESRKQPVILQLKEIKPLSEEAYNWMMSPDSIPGAHPPMMYIGRKTLEDFFVALGRSITQKEAEILVQPDGKQMLCPVTGQIFQPVKYVFCKPPTFESDLDNGMTLQTMNLPFGGCYFLSNNELVAFSGSIFERSGRNRSEGSNLMLAAATAAKLARVRSHFIWGKPRDVLQKHLNEKQAKREDRQRRQLLIQEALQGKKAGHGSIQSLGDKWPKPRP